MIHIPDNVTDTSPFCLAVQANGADAFKLALCLISRGLQGVDARIVNNFTRRDNSGGQRWHRGPGGGDCEGSDGRGI